MEILKKLFRGKGYIDGITIINLQGEILFSAKLNEKLSSAPVEKQLLGKNFYDVYENLTAENSTTYKAMQVGMPAYIENQYLKTVGEDGIYITSLSIPIKSGNRIVGAIDLSTQDFPDPANQDIPTVMTIENNPLSDKKLMSGRSAVHSVDDIIAVNETMVQLKDEISILAECDLPVMIYGETGTGKEVFAQAIHNHSNRFEKPFLAQNCAAIPETLLESILFGTAKGAFTGAVENMGLLEIANGGTLFLDEINSMPMALQAKLLRVIQEKKIRRLGAKHEQAVDLKIVTALNIDPLEAIAKGQLRSDIYYRLSMMSISIPPLRERKEDISAFVNMYVEIHNKTFKKNIKFIANELIKKLESYYWPGNIRELEQVVVYGMSQVSNNANTLEYKDVQPKLEKLIKNFSNKYSDFEQELNGSLRDAINSFERKIIVDTLVSTNGNITEAAKLLDLPRQTLQRKVQHHNIDTANPL